MRASKRRKANNKYKKNAKKNSRRTANKDPKQQSGTRKKQRLTPNNNHISLNSKMSLQFNKIRDKEKCLNSLSIDTQREDRKIALSN